VRRADYEPLAAAAYGTGGCVGVTDPSWTMIGTYTGGLLTPTLTFPAPPGREPHGLAEGLHLSALVRHRCEHTITKGRPSHQRADVAITKLTMTSRSARQWTRDRVARRARSKSHCR
jgi:hypothetical protein